MCEALGVQASTWVGVYVRHWGCNHVGVSSQSVVGVDNDPSVRMNSCHLLLGLGRCGNESIRPSKFVVGHVPPVRARVTQPPFLTCAAMMHACSHYWEAREGRRTCGWRRCQRKRDFKGVVLDPVMQMPFPASAAHLWAHPNTCLHQCVTQSPV